MQIKRLEIPNWTIGVQRRFKLGMDKIRAKQRDGVEEKQVMLVSNVVLKVVSFCDVTWLEEGVKQDPLCVINRNHVL